jgi:hypothetical protein
MHKVTKAADVSTSKLDPPGGGVGEGPEPSKELEGSSGMLYLGKASASIHPISHLNLFRQRPNGQTMSPRSNMIERALHPKKNDQNMLKLSLQR